MKTTSKTIFSLVTAGSMLFAVAYHWVQSTANAAPLSPDSTRLASKKKVTPTPTKPDPSGTVPTTPLPPTGGGELTPSTTPTEPSNSDSLTAPAPTGGGTITPPAPESGAPTAPETPTTTSPTRANPKGTAAGGTIVGVVNSSPQLKTLTAEIKAAGLEQTLSGKGPFTIFAPTDEAFAALPPGVLATLLKPENKAQLGKLLSYHVVSGKVESKALKSGSVPTLLGKSVTVKVQAKKVMVNDANVVQPDMPASNGVIHLIDKVILPSG